MRTISLVSDDLRQIKKPLQFRAFSFTSDFEVEPNGDELKSKDSKYELYSEKENNNYLVIKK